MTGTTRAHKQHLDGLWLIRTVCIPEVGALARGLPALFNRPLLRCVCPCTHAEAHTAASTHHAHPHTPGPAPTVTPTRSPAHAAASRSAPSPPAPSTSAMPGCPRSAPLLLLKLYTLSTPVSLTSHLCHFHKVLWKAGSRAWARCCQEAATAAQDRIHRRHLVRPRRTTSLRALREVVRRNIRSGMLSRKVQCRRPCRSRQRPRPLLTMSQACMPS